MSSTIVYLSGKAVKLADGDLLGEGGEARVYRHKGQALKVFHAPGPEKAQKLLRFPVGLPREVVGPLAMATNKQGQPVGYTMRLIDDAEPLARAANRAFREARLPGRALMQLFGYLAQLVDALHARQVVIGDFNDGNVLFNDEGPALIDADSMQYEGLSCTVGHERFLDPRLYGVDLSAGQSFTPGSDWYAYAVLLFSSVAGVHPFGGTHPSLPTLLRRAEARSSVFDGKVTIPRAARGPRVLPDDVAGYFREVFERDLRVRPPRQVLSLELKRCSCGLEHGRAHCPDCHALGPLVTRPVMRAQGRCTARVAFHTSGRVLALAQQGGLRYAFEERGLARREDGTELGPVSPTTTVHLAGATSWLTDAGGFAERHAGGQVRERVQTGRFWQRPIFAAAPGVAYALQGEWIVEVISGSRVGQVLEGQTWLATGERLGVGFYRAGGLTCAFLLRTGRAGLSRIEGIGWQGRLLDAHAAFDERHALLTVTSEQGGVEQLHRWLIADDAKVLAELHGGPKGRAALLNGRVVVASDGGLVALARDQRQLVEGARFPDSQPFVSEGDELFAQPDGSLLVGGSNEILQLTLS